MKYRLADEGDIDKICDLISSAILNMEKQNIFQWDNQYPTREILIDDIQNRELYVGLLDVEIAVIYTLNTNCDAEYQNGDWRYVDCEYRIIHRLCVNPKFQNKGIAKGTLLHIEKELQKLNVGAIRLDVFSNNPFALALYLNSGYEKAGIADWRKGRFYLMEKSIVFQT